jgi:hypothetical protein
MALFLLANPVHWVTSVDVDHAVASDPVDRTSSIDLNLTRHAPIVAARARKVEQGASFRRELPVSHDAVALAQRHWTRVLR